MSSHRSERDVLSHHRSSTGVIAFLGAGVLCLALTSCSSSDAPKHTTTTVPGSPVPYDKANNARADVTVSGPCTHKSGAWVLEGTLKNPGHSSSGFSLVVDFVASSGNTVEHTQIVTVRNVAPGASAPWRATWTSPTRAISCVVRQAQTT